MFVSIQPGGIINFILFLFFVKHHNMEAYVALKMNWASQWMEEYNKLQTPDTLGWRKICGRLVGSQSWSRRCASENNVQWQGFVSAQILICWVDFTLKHDC